MATSVLVWSDYVCPWCYVGLTEFAKAKKKQEVTLEVQPYLLKPDAPEEGWKLPPEIRAKMNAPDNPLTARAKALGLKLKEREHVPNSRRAHECAEVARADGKLLLFHGAVLRAYWTDGKDLHDWDVLEECAKTAGMDGPGMRKAVEGGKVGAMVKDKLEAAAELGITAVPTFVIANKYVIQGAQTRDVFERILA